MWSDRNNLKLERVVTPDVLSQAIGRTVVIMEMRCEGPDRHWMPRPAGDLGRGANPMSDGPLKEVVIYTDGAAEPNPGPGGYGVVLRYAKHSKELSAGFKRTTKNRMELLAGWPISFARRWRASGWGRRISTIPVRTVKHNEFECPISALR